MPRQERLDQIKIDDRMFLFRPCVGENKYPGMISAMLSAMPKLDIEPVISDEQTCCGGFLTFTNVAEPTSTMPAVARNVALAEEQKLDIVTMCKPMGNGHPLAAVVTRTELLDQFGEWGMYFNTFGGNPVSCAVGMAVLDVLEEEQLLDHAVEVGGFVASGLRQLQERHAIIGDVRDKGMFFAMELVDDRERKTPATEAAGSIINMMRERGVLISRIGRHDNILKLRPPMPFSSSEGQILLDTLDDCFTALGGATS